MVERKNNVGDPLFEEKIREFGEVYEIYVPRIYRYIYYRVHQIEQVTEDLTSEVMLKFLEVFLEGKVKPQSDVERPWTPLLYTMARNRVQNYLRNRSRRGKYYEPPQSLDEVLEESGIPSGEFCRGIPDSSGPEEEVVRDEEKRRVAEAVQKLPSSYQDVIILKYVEGLSNKEIGSIIGKSEGAVKSLYHRALKSLRKNY